MLSLGSSKPWPVAMAAMTGQTKMDPSAFLEYFKPLEDWLIKKNVELNIKVGWHPTESKIVIFLYYHLPMLNILQKLHAFHKNNFNLIIKY